MFSKQDTEINITLEGNEIKPSDQVELLGVIIDKKLTFNQHIEKITKKAALKLNALRRQTGLQ